MKPKETEAPGASVPFQPRFLALQRVPELVTVASQAEVTLVSAGKSHWTFHELSVVVPVFLMVHLPSKPLPQSWVLAYVAVASEAAWEAVWGAASAGAPRATRVASGSSSVVSPATARCLMLSPERVSLCVKRTRCSSGEIRGSEGWDPAPPVSTWTRGGVLTAVRRE